MLINNVKQFVRLANIIPINAKVFYSSTVHSKLFTTILGINQDQADKYIARNHLEKLDVNRLQQTLVFLKKNYNEQIDEVLKKPTLFKTCNLKTWQQYYLYLKECGCKHIAIDHLVHFRKFRCQSIKVFKESLTLPPHTNVVENLLSHLNLENPSVIKIDDLLDESLTLTHIHKEIINRYLRYRLEASDDEIEKISRLYPFTYNKSLRYLCANIDIALEIGFSKSRVMRNGYLMHATLWNTKEVLKTIPNFLGMDIREHMRNYPKLVGLSLNHFMKMYDILKKYEISDEAIRKSMNIFALTTDTVTERLEDIKSVPEMYVLMNNPLILRLIVHYHRAKTRLEFLKRIKLKCASLVVIGFEDRVFDNYLKDGKDKNLRSETAKLIGALLNCSKSDLKLNLWRHPYPIYVPFIDIQESYDFLKTKGFSNEDLTRAISVLLYPKSAIEQTLEQLKTNTYLVQRTVRNEQVLNVVLYFLEKDHHFTGNGIWRVNDDT